MILSEEDAHLFSTLHIHPELLEAAFDSAAIDYRFLYQQCKKLRLLFEKLLFNEIWQLHCLYSEEYAQPYLELDEDFVTTQCDNLALTPLHYMSFQGYTNLYCVWAERVDLFLFSEAFRLDLLATSIFSGNEALYESVLRDGKIENEAVFCERGTHMAIYAASSGSIAMLNRFSGYAHNIAKGGKNLLHFAAASGSGDVVAHILDNYPYLTTQKDESNRSFLFMAAKSGDKNLLEILNQRRLELTVQFGSDPWKDVSHHGRTLLHYAAYSGNKEALAYLIENCQLKEFMRIIDKDEKNILHIAARVGSISIMDWLLRAYPALFNFPASHTSIIHEAVLSRVRTGIVFVCEHYDLDILIPILQQALSSDELPWFFNRFPIIAKKLAIHLSEDALQKAMDPLIIHCLKQQLSPDSLWHLAIHPASLRKFLIKQHHFTAKEILLHFNDPTFKLLSGWGEPEGPQKGEEIRHYYLLRNVLEEQPRVTLPAIKQILDLIQPYNGYGYLINEFIVLVLKKKDAEEFKEIEFNVLRMIGLRYQQWPSLLVRTIAEWLVDNLCQKKVHASINECKNTPIEQQLSFIQKRAQDIFLPCEVKTVLNTIFFPGMEHLLNNKSSIATSFVQIKQLLKNGQLSAYNEMEQHYYLVSINSYKQLPLHLINIPGDTEADFNHFIDQIFKEFILAYQLGERENKLVEFFTKLADPDVCLEALMRDVQGWATAVLELPPFEKVVQEACRLFDAWQLYILGKSPSEIKKEAFLHIVELLFEGTECLKEGNAPEGRVWRHNVEPYIDSCSLYSTVEEIDERNLYLADIDAFIEQNLGSKEEIALQYLRGLLVNTGIYEWPQTIQDWEEDILTCPYLGESFKPEMRGIAYHVRDRITLDVSTVSCF